jgi:hypothetical protein
MPLTKEQVNSLLSEQLSSERVNLYCAAHLYYGPSPKNPKAKPAVGCKNCWMVFYFKQLLDTPPDKRAQFLDELTETMHKVDELVRKGEWDLKLHAPEIKIENDGSND